MWKNVQLWLQAVKETFQLGVTNLYLLTRKISITAQKYYCNYQYRHHHIHCDFDCYYFFCYYHHHYHQFIVMIFIIYLKSMPFLYMDTFYLRLSKIVLTKSRIFMRFDYCSFSWNDITHNFLYNALTSPINVVLETY